LDFSLNTRASPTWRATTIPTASIEDIRTAKGAKNAKEKEKSEDNRVLECFGLPLLFFLLLRVLRVLRGEL